MHREGDQLQEYFIVLHGNFQCVGRVFNGQTTAVEWNSEVCPGQDFFYEMGQYTTVLSDLIQIFTYFWFGYIT
jgi:hypothetical protein